MVSLQLGVSVLGFGVAADEFVKSFAPKPSLVLVLVLLFSRKMAGRRSDQLSLLMRDETCVRDGKDEREDGDTPARW